MSAGPPAGLFDTTPVDVADGEDPLSPASVAQHRVYVAAGLQTHRHGFPAFEFVPTEESSDDVKTAHAVLCSIKARMDAHVVASPQLQAESDAAILRVAERQAALDATAATARAAYVEFVAARDELAAARQLAKQALAREFYKNPPTSDGSRAPSNDELQRLARRFPRSSKPGKREPDAAAAAAAPPKKQRDSEGVDADIAALVAAVVRTYV